MTERCLARPSCDRLRAATDRNALLPLRGNSGRPTCGQKSRWPRILRALLRLREPIRWAASGSRHGGPAGSRVRSRLSARTRAGLYQQGSPRDIPIQNKESPNGNARHHAGPRRHRGERPPGAIRDAAATGDRDQGPAAFKTTEFYAFLAVLAGLLVAGNTIEGKDGGADYFAADKVWLYVTLLTVGYMISRGLAKAGSRDPYWDERGDRNASH
jgi:hypothetical protein